MKKILIKLQEARKLIKQQELKKDGRNEFSKYDYFTPAFVEKIVSDVCFELNIFTKFDLIQGEKLKALLTIYDLESEEKIQFNMITAIPEIKATNIAQQLGGTVTYSERYLKMTAFGIIDNSLDFDAKDNTKKEEKKEVEVEWLSKENYEKTLLCTDIEKIENVKKQYSTASKKMKKDYAENIQKRILELKSLNK